MIMNLLYPRDCFALFKGPKTLFLGIILLIRSLPGYADLDGTYEKGIIALEKGRYEIALEYLGVAATNQNSDAQYTLGLIFRSGLGVEQNLKTALRWFEASAKNNHPEGQFISSWMYGKGIGTSVDSKKSFDLMLRAAENNITQARVQIAWMYANGNGVETDPEKSFFW